MENERTGKQKTKTQVKSEIIADSEDFWYQCEQSVHEMIDELIKD